MKNRVVVGVIIILAALNLAGFNFVWQQYQPAAETISLTQQPHSQFAVANEASNTTTPLAVVALAAESSGESKIDEDFDGLDDRWEFMWFGCIDTDDNTVLHIVDAQHKFKPLATWQTWTVSDGLPWSHVAVCDNRIVDNPDDTSLPDVGIPNEINTDAYNATRDPDFDECNMSCEENRNSQPITYGSNDGTDTDGDGLTDGEEANIYFTSPSGGDWMYCDWNERYGMDDGSTYSAFSDGVPDGYDSDCDGVPDGVEVGVIEPNNPSWVYPGKELLQPMIPGNPYRPSYAYLPDGEDVDTYFDSIDSDGDGLFDHQEYYDETPCAGAETINRHIAATPYMCLPNLTRNPSFPVNAYFTNPTYYNEVGNPLELDGMDTDNDGLTDLDETIGFVRGPFFLNRIMVFNTYYTHPNYADSDGDGLLDGEEVTTPVYGGYTDPQQMDTDGDSLSDYLELLPVAEGGYGINPLDNDSDFDNLSDDIEVNLASNPGDPNTDGNGGSDVDGDGFASSGEMPDPVDTTSELLAGEVVINPDACKDMNDGYEVYSLGTDPTKLDTDYDGLSDCYEVDASLNPINPDSDGDGYSDGDEVAAGSSPHDSTSIPVVTGDTDNDDLQDWWELANFGNLAQIPTGDPDTDGCDNLCEFRRGTDPQNPDTDGDGLWDNEELPDSSPTIFDTDGDGLHDGQERNYTFTLNGVTQSYRLNARNKDTDGDGIEDGDEVDTSDGEIATNAGLADTDSDGLFDLLEIEPMNAVNNTAFNAAYIYRSLVETNPLLQDTDGDGWTDYQEIQMYYTQQPNPTVGDTDSDFLTDSVEGELSFTKVNDDDTDADSLNDGVEYLGFVMTLNYCPASGGAQDVSIPGYSVNTVTGLNPNSQDSDGDGLIDGAEVNTHGTNPAYVDTDNDAINDNVEIANGTNPLCGNIINPVEGAATATGYRSIQVTWAATDPPATTYEVEYSQNGVDNWLTVATVASGTTLANHTGLICNHTYYYRIRPLLNGNNMDGYNSDVFSAATLACPALSAPPAPTVSGTIQRTTLNIQVASDTSGEIQTFYLEQQNTSIIPLSWQPAATFTSAGGIHTATGLTCGIGYKYRVRGYRLDDTSYSPYSTELTVTTTACPALSAPPAPTVSGTIQRTSVNIQVASDTSGEIQTFYLEQQNVSDIPLSWQPAATFTSAGGIHTASGLTCGTGYKYRVRGYRVEDNSYSPYSTELAVTTAACPVLSAPPVPTVSGVIQRTTLNIQVASDTSGAIQNLYLEQQNPGGLPLTWHPVATFTSSGGIYTAQNLTCGTGHSYRVRGHRTSDNTYSPYSPTLTVMTAPCQELSPNTIGLYRNGIWNFRNIDTEETATIRFGPQESGWTPVIGNWNGGMADGLGLYRNGLFILRNASDGGTVDNRYYFGPRESGWQPLVGDWNGDGVETVGVFKEGVFMLTNAPDGSRVDYRFRLRGGHGWQVIAGDWDGNGAASVGLYQDGNFYITNTLDGRGVRRPFSFGPTASGWIPLAGDWDANGIATIGIYRESIWRLRNSNNTGSVDIGFNFGARESGWQPVTSYRGGIAILAVFAAAENNVAFSESAANPVVPELTAEAIATELTAEPELTPLIEVTAEITIEATEAVIITPEPTTETPVVESTPEPELIVTATPEPVVATESALIETLEPTLVPEITAEPVETIEEAPSN
jgi:hypothetical protein